MTQIEKTGLKNRVFSETQFIELLPVTEVEDARENVTNAV